MKNRLPRAPKVMYKSVNQCIYCGIEEDGRTNEHIIPYGLNGNLVLPNSSCTKCAKITSEVERRVLRGFLENGRRAIGISSRHKKHKKLSTVPITFISGEKRFDEKISIEGGFHTIPLPIFATPLALVGKASNDQIDDMEIVGMDTLHIGDATATAQKHHATGVEIKTQVDIWAFIRMLAKIAYSYYVAEKGIFPLRESPVLPIAMGEHSNAKQWIGCLEDHPITKPGSKALHLLDITEITGEDCSICSVVRIKLLSVTSGPTYAVIVRIRDGVAA